MKRATKAQREARKVGHQFVGEKGGKCDTCGLVDNKSITLHSEEWRDRELVEPTLLPAEDIPAGNTPETEATGSMSADANPSAVTVKITRVKGTPKPPKPSEPAKEPEPRGYYVPVERDVLESMAGELLSVRGTEAPQPRTPLIFSAIHNAMKAIHPLMKTETHPDGFDFRRIDIILAEIQPILVTNKIFYAPTSIVSSEQVDRPVRLVSGESWVNIFTRITVRYRVYCSLDGSFIDVEAQGEGVSEQQHSTAAAQTMAEKTMICDLFCIPVYGGDDPESAVTERSQAKDFPTGPAPESGQLFDTGTTPKTRRTRKPQEPQTTSVAGAALDEPAQVEDKSLAGGFIKILEAGMKPKGVTEAILFEHFKVEGWSGLKVSQMGELSAWIQGYVAPVKEEEK